MATPLIGTKAVSSEGNWTRHGECDGCGWCCMAIGRVMVKFPFAGRDPEFDAVRGITDDVRIIEVVDPCSKLDQDTKRCTIYEKRPQTCRKWPEEPDEIVGTPCTYWFEREDGMVVGGDRSPHPGVTPPTK